MPYVRTQTVNPAQGGDSVKQAILDLDTDLTVAFTSINTHEALTAAHGITATPTEVNHTAGVTSAIQGQLDTKAPIASPTFTGTVGGITKAMVGLGSVDNTADVEKPISAAVQTALDGKAAVGVGTAFRGALVYNNTEAVGIPINWSAESYDTDNIHEGVANPSRLTVPAGVTKVRLLASHINKEGYTAKSILYKGNVSALGGWYATTNGNTTTNNAVISSSAVLNVVGGDYFQVHMAGTAPADSTGSLMWFAMEIIE